MSASPARSVKPDLISTIGVPRMSHRPMAMLMPRDTLAVAAMNDWYCRTHRFTLVCTAGLDPSCASCGAPPRVGAGGRCAGKAVGRPPSTSNAVAACKRRSRHSLGASRREGDANISAIWRAQFARRRSGGGGHFQDIKSKPSRLSYTNSSPRRQPLCERRHFLCVVADAATCTDAATTTATAAATAATIHGGGALDARRGDEFAQRTQRHAVPLAVAIVPRVVQRDDVGPPIVGAHDRAAAVAPVGPA